MESVYIYPFYDGEDNTVDTVVARSRVEAEERIIRKITDDYEDIPYPADYVDLKSSLLDVGMVLGDVIELDELLN